MNIVVISDTHGFLPSSDEFFALLDEADRIYHLGDGLREIRTLEYAYGEKLVWVAGNNDPVFGKSYAIDDADGVKILLTHGHDFGVKSSLTKLAAFAKERGASHVFYGHTHIQSDDETSGVRLINPGSLRRGYYCFAAAHEGRLVARQMKRFV